MEILLGQLGSNGDCLYATILARQIKQDFPQARLTWAISSLCKHLLHNNPDVDDIIEVQVSDWTQQQAAWENFEAEVLRRQTQPGAFDRVILSQIWPNNFRNYDGTIRPSILRAYGKPVEVAIDNIIVLDDEEQSRVDKFVKKHRIHEYQHRILFECSSKSGQSYVTPDYAIEVARLVSDELNDVCTILSSHQKLATKHPNIVDGSSLTIRENAALTKVCTQFVGCGSGLTVVATSNVSKQLPNIQLLSGHTSFYGSFAHDFEYWGMKTDHFTEMVDADAQKVADAITASCRDGFEICREKYHKPARLSFEFYQTLINTWLLNRCKYADAARSVSVTAQRYGWHPELLRFAKESVAPMVKLDPSCRFSAVSEELERFLDTVYAQ